MTRCCVQGPIFVIVGESNVAMAHERRMPNPSPAFEKILSSLQRPPLSSFHLLLLLHASDRYTSHRCFLSTSARLSAAAIMDDDDDAFLYGDEPAQPAAAVNARDTPNGASTAAVSSKPELNDVSAAAQGDLQDQDGQGDDKDEEEEEEGDDDDDDDDEDSDSDIEFIIDATQEAQPPARSGFQRPAAPGARPLPTQSTPQRPQSTLTSEYTPLSRSQLLANASPASAAAASTALAQATASTSLASLLPAQTTPQPSTALDGAAPEGGPPSVPSNAPALNLSPGPQDRAYPKPEDIVDQEESSTQDIFDMDLEKLADKPWRRYGADLTDYFNYGFNEESWSLWRGKKQRITDARKNAENNAFGGHNGDMMSNMQQMMSMMPPPQAMQAMMSHNGGGPGGAGPMGMPPMPPDQMMAMMASMSGMPGMPPMPGMPNMPGNMPPMGGGGGARGMNQSMMPGMFGAHQSNGGPPAHHNDQHNQQQQQQQQQQQRFSHSPFPQAPKQFDAQHNSPYPQSQDRDARSNDQQAEHRDHTRGWDTPADDSIKQESKDDAQLGLAPSNAGGPAIKPMSEADMSLFLGAAGVDPSQAAAAGFPVPSGINDASDARRTPSAPPTKPGPPKTAPSGPAAAKGTSIRGRAAAAAGSAPSSSRAPRAVSPTLPPNVPSGPKNPGKRYNDRDTGAGAADLLDYGATAGGGGGGDDDRGYTDGWDSKERSPDRNTRRSGGAGSSGRSRREGTYDHDTASANGRDNNDDGGHSSRRGANSSSRSSKRTAADEWDDDAASQSSASGRRRRATGGGSSSHRSDSQRERESSSSHRDRDRSDRDREREKDKEREREARSQARSERRAGRDMDEPAIPTGPAAGVSGSSSSKSSRKRSAPEDRDADEHRDGPASKSSSSSRKGGSRKKR
ncbi:hypothetical protein PHSY_002781 [Pseudozyma hubeiensis SY62]|uniref:Pre-mRNA polyadenylation factor Fip1 domain-containing protein n=1 Tax=Pseudozyma hubeiensis (strain SY62) TaxID=1305764 RepID=R9P1S5_PSEHS|nr:hypothetical protein PHSY_002781 [Pseudozyma hubeiensis SY62]GAC95206.1 hypothetical protein PHSY_002781 [Pseudozyma hubeiensis SY62]